MDIGKCPKCGSDDVKAIRDRSRTPPRWACMKCGHVWGGLDAWDDKNYFDESQNGGVLVYKPSNDEHHYICEIHRNSSGDKVENMTCGECNNFDVDLQMCKIDGRSWRNHTPCKHPESFEKLEQIVYSVGRFPDRKGWYLCKHIPPNITIPIARFTSEENMKDFLKDFQGKNIMRGSIENNERKKQ